MSGNIGSATFALRVDATAFEAGLRRAEQQATQITGKIGNLFKGGLAVGLGINTFNTGLVATRRILDAAAEGVVHFNSTLDDTKATFTTFLGSVDAANAKVGELFELAAKTPFDFAQVTKAATALQAFGGNALNTQKNLELFADTASAVQGAAGGLSVAMERVTFWSGRLFAALQSHQAIGRVAKEMSELGIVSRQTITQIQLAVEEGASPDEAFQVYLDALQKFEGQNKRLENNFSVLFTSLQDRFAAFSAMVGRPIFDEMIRGMKALNDLLQSNRAKEFGESLRTAVGEGVAAFRGFISNRQNQQDALKIGQEVLDSFKAFASLLVQVANAIRPTVQLVANFIALLNRIAGDRLLVFGVAAVAVTKYRRELALLRDVMTGTVDVLRGQRDAQGRLLTASEALAQQQKDAVRATKELEAAREQLARANERVTSTEENLIRAGRAQQSALAEQGRARAAFSGAVQQAGAAQSGLQVARRYETLATAGVQAAGGEAALRKTIQENATARRQEAAAIKEEQAATTAYLGTQSQLTVATQRLTAARVAATQALGDEGIALASVNRAMIVASQATADLTVAQQAQANAQAQLTLAQKENNAIQTAQRAAQRRESSAQRRLSAAEFTLQATPNDAPAIRAKTKATADLAIAQRELLGMQADVTKYAQAQTAAESDLAVARGLSAQRAKDAESAEAAVVVARRAASAAASRAVAASKDAQAALAAESVAKARDAAASQRLAAAQAESARITALLNNGAQRAQALLDAQARATANLAKAQQEAAAASNAAYAASQRLQVANTTVTRTEENLDRARRRANIALDGQSKAAETVKDKQGALALATTNATSLIGKMTTITLAAAAAFTVLNAATQAAFGSDFLETLKGWALYGDTLGAVRAQMKGLKEEMEDLSGSDASAKIAKDLKAAQVELQRLQQAQKALADPRNKDFWTEVFEHPGDLFSIGALTRQEALIKELQGAQQALNKEIEEANKARADGNTLTERQLQLLKDVGQQQQQITPKTAPEAAIFERLRTQAEQLRVLGEQGMEQYLKGFTHADFEALDDAKAIMLTRLKFDEEGKLSASDMIKVGNVQPILTELVYKINHDLPVDQIDLSRLFKEAGGGETGLDLTNYIQQLEATHRAENDVTHATEALNAALANQKAVADHAAQALKPLEAALRSAQAAAQRHAREFSDAVDAQQAVIKGIQEEAEGVARGFQDQIEGIQESIRVTQRAQQQRNDAFAEQLRQLGQERDAAQTLATEHAEAYQAVLEGTLDLYYREHDAIDESTRKIIEQNEAAIAGQRRLRDATQDRVNQLNREQRKTTLEFEERIEAARQRGDYREAARIRRQQQTQSRRADRQINLAQLRAGVAQDEFDIRAEKIRKEATAVASNDKIRQQAIDDRIKTVEEEQRIQNEADKQALDALNEQLRLKQKEAQDSARAYEDKIRNEQKILDKINESAKAQAKKDQDAIDKANIALGIQQAINDAQKAIADKRVADAQAVLDDAKEEYETQKDILSTFKDRLAYIKDIRKEWTEWILEMQNAGLLEPGGGPRRPAAPGRPGPEPGFEGAPTGGGGGGGGGGATPTATPQNAPPAMPGPGPGPEPTPPNPGPTIGGQPGTGLQPGLPGESGADGPDGGGSWPAGSLERRVELNTGSGDQRSRRAKLAMMMGALMEGQSWDGPWGVGDGGMSFGPYQVHSGAHPNWPRSRSENLDEVVPAMAAGTITGTGYIAAANSIPETSWQNDPAYSGAYAAYLAEKPLDMYPKSTYNAAFQKSRGSAGFWQGGVIRERIMGTGLSGQQYEFGERGPELVLPLPPAMRGVPLPALPPNSLTLRMNPHLAHRDDPTRGRNLRDTGTVGGAVTVHIGTVNASDPRDVEAMVDMIEERFLGTHLAGVEIAKRGGVLKGFHR